MVRKPVWPWVFLGAALGLAVLVFMFAQGGGRWEFLLRFRGQKLWAMVLVGCALGVSTLIFQTLTTNRILTPSIMGLDALYLLGKMTVIFVSGSVAFLDAPPLWVFYADVALMCGAAVLLFGGLHRLLLRDVYRLLLIGIIFGVLCMKLTDLMARMMDPAEYTKYQSLAFAQFNRPRAELLPSATLITVGVLGYAWYKRHVLDVMALGYAQAVALGVAYRREMLVLMGVVALLVAVSTALVGPVVFFGLLVSALVYRLFPTPFHARLLPAAAMVAVLILVAGQTLFERAFGFAGTLSIVIEGVGGVVFLVLLLSRKRS